MRSSTRRSFGPSPGFGPRRWLGWLVAAWLDVGVGAGLGVGLGPHAALASEPEAARDPRAADEAYAQAQELYERGEMLEAAEALEQAYALDPRPEFLYQRGHALREAGSCRAAIDSFEAFIAVTTSPENRQTAQKWIERCQRVLASEPEPGRMSNPELQPEPTPTSETSPSPPRIDRWGVAGLGVGAGLAVLGGALLGSSYAVAGGGSATQTETEYLARERRARALSVSGIVSLSVGGAALVAAAVRLGVVAARRRGDALTGSPRRRSRVALAVDGVVVRF